MKKSRAFVPKAGQLEDRLALSGVQFNSLGEAILTTRTLNNVYRAIENAYSQFANHGLNYNQLSYNLTRAVSPIPYNLRDGLAQTIQAEVTTLSNNMNAGVSSSVLTSMYATDTDVQNFVIREQTAKLLVIPGQSVGQIVPNGTQFNSLGQAILSTRTLNNVYRAIENAYSQFANHGLNYNQLSYNLTQAVSPIPYNLRDGLTQTIQVEVTTLSNNVLAGVNRPVLTSMFAADTDVQNFVVREQTANRIVVV